MSMVMRVAGLLALSAAGLAWGQAAGDKKDAKPAAPRWTILFRSDKAAHWGKDAKNDKGEQVAIPLRFAPEATRYLRLRRMDTGEALILPLTRDQLENAKPADPDEDFWWNGTAKLEWGGRHLGIAGGARIKFPAPRGLIHVMNEGWDGFYGSGFGHKCGANDGQYYCWRGKEIKRTAFEIAVSEGPLSAEEKRCLVSKP
jgi:hypothetical protein